MDFSQCGTSAHPRILSLFKISSYMCSFSTFCHLLPFFFFFLATPTAWESSLARNRTALPLQPAPQLWQCRILNPLHYKGTSCYFLKRKKKNLTVVDFYNVLSISAVQQSDPVIPIYRFFFTLSSIMFHHK